MTCHAVHPLPAAVILAAPMPAEAEPAPHEIPLSAIARSFGQAAPHYDAHAVLQRQVADQLLGHLAAATPARILDLGCGTGYCSLGLRNRFARVPILALDVALPMLKVTQAQGLAALDVICGDAAALPLQDDSVDLVVSSLAMQWCRQARQLFAELHRVTRAGGEVLLSTFGPATLAEVRAAWATVNGAVHVNGFVPLAVLEAAATAAGFAVHGVTERRQRSYESLRAVARELKGVGAHNMNAGRPRGLTGRAAFAQAEAAFAAGIVPGQGIPVTWEVFYLVLRKPVA